MSQWETVEDIERDLFEYSQLEYPGNSLTTAPPKSISEYRARTQATRNPGLFDEEPEAKEIFISGRGKHHPGHIIRPGVPVASTPQEDMDLRKKIREVSGLGYSNEIIEKMYGRDESTASDDEDTDDSIVLPNLKLRPYKPSQKQKGGSSGRESKKLSRQVLKRTMVKNVRDMDSSEDSIDTENVMNNIPSISSNF